MSSEDEEMGSPRGAAEGTAALPTPGSPPGETRARAIGLRATVGPASHHHVVSSVPQTWTTNPALIVTLSSLNVNRVQQTFFESSLHASLCKGADGDTLVQGPEPGTLGP